jgi:acetoacetyl-CoA synthetase
MSGGVVNAVNAGAPGATTIDALTQIWQRVLQKSPIGVADKFYDIGGTDPLADKLFAEIESTFQRRMPSATICYAPTIATLAALLEQAALPRFPPFVQLAAGSRSAPVLIAHGVGGRASFSELARHLRTDNPVYGIQAKGVDGLEEPLKTIEEMAAYYIGALGELPAQGPCLLIGYSFGGLIALEMAQRLVAQGKPVGLLTLVDTYPHPRYFPLDQRLWLDAKRVKEHSYDLMRKPFRVAAAEVLRAARRRLRRPDTHSSAPVREGGSRRAFAETTLHVKQSDFLAMKLYRPRFYPGTIKFVRPELNSYLPNDPALIWKNLVKNFDVETVPGDHLGMIGTHFESLAAVLTRYVEEAAAE